MNSDLTTETQLSDLAFITYQKNIKVLQEKEKYISQLPYAEEYPRLYYYKYDNCKSITARAFWWSAIFTFPMTGVFLHFRYHGGAHTPLRYWKTFPLAGLFHFTFTYLTHTILMPACQSINRDDMAASTIDEEVFKYLIEKTDMYDNIDALLELRDKYSKYEIEQVAKEWKTKRIAVVTENLEEFRNKRHISIGKTNL